MEPPKVGELIDDKYLLERQLGQGGMGTVFAARHRLLGERVALKVMLDVGEATDEVRQRFMNEARLATRIQSPHVARPRDSGFWQGLPYIAMELMEGEDLEQSLERRGPLPIPEAIDIVTEIADALTKAHAEQIVHRDIKTANIFLAQRPDGTVTAKLLDFGISKAPPAMGSPSLTRTSSVMGSPNYMSPEQLKSTKSVDPRTDVWSLAVVLHEILTNQSPFFGESFAQIFMSIISGEIPTIRSRRPDCPAEVDEAVSACLVRDREHRTASVGAFAARIAPFGTQRAQIALRRIAGEDPDARGSAPPGGDPERTVMAKAELVDALRGKGDPDRTVIAVDGKLDGDEPDSDRTMLAPSSTATPPVASPLGSDPVPPFGTIDEESGEEEGAPDSDRDRTVFSAQASPYASDPRIQAAARAAAAGTAPPAGVPVAPAPPAAPMHPPTAPMPMHPSQPRMHAPSIPDVPPPSQRGPAPSFHSAGQLPAGQPSGSWQQPGAAPPPPMRAPMMSQPMANPEQAMRPAAPAAAKPNVLLFVVVGAAVLALLVLAVGVFLFLRARP